MAKGATIDGEVFISIGKRNNIYIYIYMLWAGSKEENISYTFINLIENLQRYNAGKI